MVGINWNISQVLQYVTRSGKTEYDSEIRV